MKLQKEQNKDLERKIKILKKKAAYLFKPVAHFFWTVRFSLSVSSLSFLVYFTRSRWSFIQIFPEILGIVFYALLGIFFLIVILYHKYRESSHTDQESKSKTRGKTIQINDPETAQREAPILIDEPKNIQKKGAISIDDIKSTQKEGMELIKSLFWPIVCVFFLIAFRITNMSIEIAFKHETSFWSLIAMELLSLGGFCVSVFSFLSFCSSLSSTLFNNSKKTDLEHFNTLYSWTFLLFCLINFVIAALLIAQRSKISSLDRQLTKTFLGMFLAVDLVIPFLLFLIKLINIRYLNINPSCGTLKSEFFLILFFFFVGSTVRFVFNSLELVLIHEISDVVTDTKGLNQFLNIGILVIFECIMQIFPLILLCSTIQAMKIADLTFHSILASMVVFIGGWILQNGAANDALLVARYSAYASLPYTVVILLPLASPLFQIVYRSFAGI